MDRLSMNIPITASYKLTLAEYLLCQEMQRLNSPLRNFKMKTTGLGMFMVVGGILITMDRGIYSAAMFFLPGGVVMLALPWVLRHYTLKHFYKSPERNLVINWKISPDRIHSYSEVASSEFSWQVVSKVLKTKHGFLFYKNDVPFNWVPLHAFPDVEAIESFSQLIQTKIQKYEY